MSFYRLILETTDGPVVVAQTTKPILCLAWEHWLYAEHIAGECLRMLMV